MSGVQSIERAFALLRALSVGPAGITELAERADIPKSTVARLLATLEQEGAVEQIESWGQYQLGQAINDLAGAVAPGRNLINAARPQLWELNDQIGETAGIAILEESEVLYLDHIESSEEVQVRSWTGERVAAHLVPSGLILLAHETPENLENYFKQPLQKSTTKSLDTPADIKAKLVELREKGVAWGFGEFDEDINSIAAPVIAGGKAVAAIHVHGPAFRFPSDSEMDEIARLLVEAAERLASHLV